MFTSDTDRTKFRPVLIDLGVTAFCILFGAVYELFSHGVYAYGMIYAFVFPLLLGALPLLLILYFDVPYPRRMHLCAWHAGIATLTIGSIVSGALEIYGTTNPLIIVYWILGILLLDAGLFGYGLLLMKTRAAA